MKTLHLALLLLSALFLLTQCEKKPEAAAPAQKVEAASPSDFQKSLHEFQIDCEKLAVLMARRERDREAMVEITESARVKLLKLAETGHLSSISFADLTKEQALKLVSDEILESETTASFGAYSGFVMADIITSEEQENLPWNPAFPPALMAECLEKLIQSSALTERDQQLISDWRTSNPAPHQAAELSPWNKLSASVQNSRYFMSSRNATAADFSDLHLASITAPTVSSLNQLGTEGIVKRKAVTYQIDTRQEKPFAKIFELRDLFTENYGPLSTNELIGFGVMTRATLFPHDQVTHYQSIIHLPETEMAQAVEFLRENQLATPASMSTDPSELLRQLDIAAEQLALTCYNWGEQYEDGRRKFDGFLSLRSVFDEASEGFRIEPQVAQLDAILDELCEVGVFADLTLDLKLTREDFRRDFLQPEGMEWLVSCFFTHAFCLDIGPVSLAKGQPSQGHQRLRVRMPEALLSMILKNLKSTASWDKQSEQTQALIDDWLANHQEPAPYPERPEPFQSWHEISASIQNAFNAFTFRSAPGNFVDGGIIADYLDPGDRAGQRLAETGALEPAKIQYRVITDPDLPREPHDFETPRILQREQARLGTLIGPLTVGMLTKNLFVYENYWQDKGSQPVPITREYGEITIHLPPEHLEPYLEELKKAGIPVQQDL